MPNGSSPRVIYDIKAAIETESPLHVGTGHSVAIDTVVGKEGSNIAPEVAAIVRDDANLPYLPGTTIKGLLRRLAEAQDDGLADRLFGSIKTNGSGQPGRVTVFGARCTEAPAIPEAPFVDGAETQLKRGVFVAARTRVDPESGTAGDHKLFHQEMVAPKTRFELRLRVDTRAPIDASKLTGAKADHHGRHTQMAVCTKRNAHESARADLEKLLGVLRALGDADGQAIGKGQTDGFGRIRLDPNSLVVTGRALQSDGAFAEFDPKLHWSIDRASGVPPLRFTCDGPFLVLDSSKKLKPGENPDGEKPHNSPQRWRERLPMLLGSSVSGALRARARWLAMREGLRKNQSDTEIDAIDPDAFEYQKGMDVNKLSSVQRLFGVTGFRGRLGITRLKVQEAVPWDVTSVKLDRFTGGPVDNALFKTRGFLGVTFELSLAIEPRPLQLAEDKRKEDEQLFLQLQNHISADGLVLGHGGNKGFGWFRCEEMR